ncbi:biotin-dependent carboxyltransferase family protein [Marinomonas sp.]|nr:biotin-dependent carboxyltransferase family protein [Marinomonas sp.]MDB4837523.1 biotin-dependent carboxyltransferase family protein [Marinomonas sp.]
MIEVITPGIQTSIQDRGRNKYRTIGVGFSGAMDTFSFAIANHLVLNVENSAVLEITYGNVSLRFRNDTYIALTGADAGATLDSKAVPCWWSIPVKTGQTLRLKISTEGLRTYLAVAGGFDVPSIMASKSTDLKTQIGGLSGRSLRKGDELPISRYTGAQHPSFGLSKSLQPTHKSRNGEWLMRFVVGAEWQHLTDYSQQLFLSFPWQVSNETNRLGSRLEGAPLSLKAPLELMSHGIVPGCIQLPPSGKPVIQLQDANTCGGYPKIGVVIASDMRLLAQMKPGDAVRFKICNVEDALEIAKQERKKLSKILHHIDVMRCAFSS